MSTEGAAQAEADAADAERECREAMEEEKEAARGMEG